MASLNFVIFETENPSIFGYFEEKCKCLHVTKSAFTYYWAFYGTSHTHIQISFSQIMTCSGKNSGFFSLEIPLAQWIAFCFIGDNLWIGGLKCILLSKLGSGKFKVEKGRMVEETSLNDIYLALYQYYIKLTIYVFIKTCHIKTRIQSSNQHKVMQRYF